MRSLCHSCSGLALPTRVTTPCGYSCREWKSVLPDFAPSLPLGSGSLHARLSGSGTPATACTDCTDCCVVLWIRLGQRDGEVLARLFRLKSPVDSIDCYSASYCRIDCTTSRDRQKHNVCRIRPISHPLKGRVTPSNAEAAYGKRARDAEPLGRQS